MAVTGRWFSGHVHGRLVDGGWGSALGFPALIPDPDGAAVAVEVLESAELPSHWARLDEFEGEAYHRAPITVHTDDGDVVAKIYLYGEA